MCGPRCQQVLFTFTKTTEGCLKIKNYAKNKVKKPVVHLKGLSHEIDFKNVVENGQILALIRAAAGF